MSDPLTIEPMLETLTKSLLIELVKSLVGDVAQKDIARVIWKYHSELALGMMLDGHMEMEAAGSIEDPLRRTQAWRAGNKKARQGQLLHDRTVAYWNRWIRVNEYNSTKTY